MAVTLNASTSTGIEVSSDTSGNLNIQSGGSTKLAITSAGAAVTGTLSATSFSGDGSALTGLSGPNFTDNYVRLSGAQQTNNQGSTTKYISETEQSDTNGWWDSTNHKFLPNKAGWYQVIVCYAPWRAGAGTCVFHWKLYKNGSELGHVFSSSMNYTDRTNNGPGYINTTFLVYMNGTTDYLENYMSSYDYTNGGAAYFTMNHMFINWVGV